MNVQIQSVKFDADKRLVEFVNAKMTLVKPPIFFSQARSVRSLKLVVTGALSAPCKLTIHRF